MLREKNLGTFGHMITGAHELLKNNPAVLEEERKKIKFLLVDEFQDANFAQVEILAMLAGTDANIFIVGDPDQNIVGFGTGKAREVPAAIRKGIESAKKNLMKVIVVKTTIPHISLGTFGSGKVLLKPAPEGTGVIAGGAVRAVMTSAGVQNVLTKSLGTANPHNVIKATFDALTQLRDKADVALMRGKTVEEL